ncbi:MAG: hypothetical protein GY935_28235 [Gammaproteobacteria bacterium]|nr:hypothetical protein [Gammaproteobacteria bacterium]
MSKSIKKNLGLFVLIALFALSRPVFAGGQNFLINDAQALHITELGALSDDDSRRLAFSAFNNDFDVEIWKNQKIHERIDSGRINAVGNFYAGILHDKPDSWVRLSEIDDQWSGAIFDGYELYFVDALTTLSSELENHVAARLSALDTNTLIVRASDMEQIGTCALEDTGATGNVYQDLLTSLDIAAAASRQLNLAIVTDTEYNNAVNGDVTSAALAQINVVEGIYDSQVNLAFGISEVRVLNNNGSLTSTNASTLLNAFRSYVNSNIGNPGLAHLFTGKNMSGNTIGIAYLNAACGSSGVGVSEAHRGATGSLIVAHEIGHNTGAPHDNQSGSACANEPGIFLMNPSINGSDEFSSCSQNQINRFLASVNCLVPPDEPPPPPEPPQPPPTGSCLFSASFNSGDDGFVFTPDPQTPNLTVGAAGNGDLQITVGGGDNADVTDMLGLWQRRCTTDTALNVTLTLDARLVQTSEYESDELSEVLVSVNGQETLLATLTGDGNGGPNQDTGFIPYRVNLSLPAGSNVISLGCFNNKKTYNDESSFCTFDNVSVAEAGGALLDADFDSGKNGFSFVDYAQNPAITAGWRMPAGGVNASGGLRVRLGGRNNDDITDLTGAWTRSFASNGNVTLSVDANLFLASDYEPDEYSEVRVMVDNEVFTIPQLRLVGDGKGGNDQTTGFQTLTQSLALTEGEHQVTLECFNNKKTYNNEVTICIFDNLKIE